MNTQEIFDHVSQHLLKQGAPSKRDHRCLLRDDHGRMCAVGCLILEDSYNPSLEELADFQAHHSFRRLDPWMIEVLEPVIGEMNQEKFDLLRDLQALHDDRRNDWTPEYLNDRLMRIKQCHVS